VSLHLVEVEDARAFGCVPTDEQWRVTGFVEKSERPVTHQVNAGCYVFRRRVVDLIPQGREVSVERETFPALVDGGAIVVGYLENAYWRDVGTPEALVAVSKDLVLGVATSPAVLPSPSGASVHPTARVAGAVGGGSVVGTGAIIASGARVTGSVVMAYASVEEDARVSDSLLGPGAVVGAAAVLERVTLGDGARAKPGVRPEPGSRIDCDATI
jgi:mannose-1-phosphate guanylyltransferase